MEERKKSGQDAPPSKVDDWSNVGEKQHMSAGWPLLWMAILLAGIVLWGYLGG